MSSRVQEEDWWVVGNKDFKQVPFPFTFTDFKEVPIADRNQPPRKSDSPDNFEEEFMGIQHGPRWPFLTPGYECEYVSRTKIKDERNLGSVAGSK
jgi:hypothetical protein